MRVTVCWLSFYKGGQLNPGVKKVAGILFYTGEKTMIKKLSCGFKDGLFLKGEKTSNQNTR